MFQIVILMFGAVVIYYGVAGLKKGVFMLSKTKPVQGTAATIGNLVTLLIGLSAVGFALFGIPKF